MANDIIYSTYDAGDVVIFDNAVYIKEGEVNHFPERGKKNSDKEYTETTFDYDDNNELSGTLHNVWTAEEMAIANLSEHSGYINSPEEHQFIAPIGGIFRFCGSYRNTDIKIYINDAFVTPWANFDRSELKESIAFKLLKDDVVKISKCKNGSVYGTGPGTYIFLPYQYPYE